VSNEALELLRDAEWLKRDGVQQVFALLGGDEDKIKAVGGIVRNTLLGDTSGDVDFATVHEPKDVMQLALANGIKAIPTGLEHGTITLLVGGETYEVTTLRQDVKTDGRHAEVEFGTDWFEDAMRRDFTMNALYAGPTGELLDPLSGLEDCLNKNVRFIGDPKKRIKEDYLRILRFYRFFAYYGSGRPDADGLRATVGLKSGLDQLSVERVWQELKKLLSAPDPSRALLWMRTTGVLASILPEGEKWGIDAIHGVVAADAELNWPADPMLRLCSILPPNPERMVELSKRLKLSNAERDQLQQWAMVDGVSSDMSDTDAKKLLYWGNVGAIEIAVKLSLANMRQKAGESIEAAEKAAGYARLLTAVQSWQKPKFPLQGQDLIDQGVEAGPKLGEALKAMEIAWVDSGFALTREKLLSGLI